MTRTPLAVLLCAAALVLSGCASAQKFNPFAEKDAVIPGERRPVFEAGSGFEGPRKLPPPDSDYVGATMRVGEPLPATAAPQGETAPGAGASAPVGGAAAPAPATSSAPRAEPLPVPPPPQ